MKLITVTVGNLGENCYIAYCEKTKEAAVVDPGDDASKILREIDKLGVKVCYIINTHGHSDHIGANRAIKQATGAPILIHGQDAEMLIDPRQNLSVYMEGPVLSDPADQILCDGDEISVGEETMKVLYTPGHTKGGVCLHAGQFLFSGDTLFADSIGRCDLPGGSMAQLVESIRAKLLPLPDNTLVYPGHGPATTIGRERAQNPYLNGGDFV